MSCEWNWPITLGSCEFSLSPIGLFQGDVSGDGSYEPGSINPSDYVQQGPPAAVGMQHEWKSNFSSFGPLRFWNLSLQDCLPRLDQCRYYFPMSYHITPQNTGSFAMFYSEWSVFGRSKSNLWGEVQMKARTYFISKFLARGLWDLENVPYSRMLKP